MEVREVVRESMHSREALRSEHDEREWKVIRERVLQVCRRRGCRRRSRPIRTRTRMESSAPLTAPDYHIRLSAFTEI